MVPRVRELVRLAFREPFLQFVVLGVCIWWGCSFWRGQHDRHEINWSAEDRERVVLGFASQFGRPPSPQELQGLIERAIRDEIFYREGIALHLDQDDEIIRRRIAQKYAFLQEDLSAEAPPSHEALARWFDQHKLSYRAPAHVALTQLFFSADRDGEIAARTRATDALTRLRGAALHMVDLGDSFPGPSQINSLTPDEALRLFGESELTEHLFHLAVGEWSGPYRSGYGWHLVRVLEVFPSAQAALDEIHDQVLADYLDEQRRTVNERIYAALRGKYTIRYDGAKL